MVLAEEYLKGEKGDTFFTKDYILPEKIAEKKNKILTIKFQAAQGSRTAGIYGVRLMKVQ